VVKKIMATRRSFLKTSALTAAAATLPGCSPKHSDVALEVGVTTGSFMRHITFEPAENKISMLELPRIMRDELDMRVIDFMSRTLESFEPAYLDKLRQACDDHGCIVTNLKCNQQGLDMASADEEKRAHSIQTYKESIDAAHHLGARWIRPMAGAGRNPDRNRLVDAYHQLIDYAAPKNISILIENVGWIANNPLLIPEMIAMVGEGLHASPDTGNWPDDETRYPGLQNAYPYAVTSDFKAFQLEPDNSHPKYDLEKCFTTGWDANFRGPWVIEHFHTDLRSQLKGFLHVSKLLKTWIAAKVAATRRVGDSDHKTSSSTHHARLPRLPSIIPSHQPT
jgi:hypothetical protein